MAKTTTYNRVQDINLSIVLNSNSNGLFTPIVITTNMTAVADDGGSRNVQIKQPVGNPRQAEYTPTELANLVKGANNSTGNFLLAELTKAYNDAIGGVE